ncbi:MAG: hypothetical protein COW63_16850 [Bacteroidetes bacterium CG18_big_fil_WC_8_21_14_2_50_41_14]|nr:MAG: hypothetical protein COW63_16850 [Bacteroidetes bacterium CG18_big_fil_WC_8_21_14_2_50_41_14]PJB58922.1 MAG: hypothetical protein CO098_06115 [Bacteroidetes bacterium CG_4_9_14_3_um_filter_41_19]
MYKECSIMISFKGKNGSLSVYKYTKFKAISGYKNMVFIIVYQYFTCFGDPKRVFKNGSLIDPFQTAIFAILWRE